MRIIVLASFLLASATFSANAVADTINFASTPGVTTFTAPQEGSGTAVAYPNSAYAQPLPGSYWISTDSNGGYSGNETVLYTDSFTLLPNESYSGSISFMADNYAGVKVNGVEIYPISASTGYTSATTISLLSSYFHPGANTITLEAQNTGGPGGADFAGALTGVTPEPSSFILLGTGLLGTVAAARRRFRKV